MVASFIAVDDLRPVTGRPGRHRVGCPPRQWGSRRSPPAARSRADAAGAPATTGRRRRRWGGRAGSPPAGVPPGVGSVLEVVLLGLLAQHLQDAAVEGVLARALLLQLRGDVGGALPV